MDFWEFNCSYLFRLADFLSFFSRIRWQIKIWRNPSSTRSVTLWMTSNFVNYGSGLNCHLTFSRIKSQSCNSDFFFWRDQCHGLVPYVGRLFHTRV
jgi:hypothetical protein